MKNQRLTKGDVITAKGVLAAQSGEIKTTIQQFQRNAEIAKANGLVEFSIDVDGGYYAPTEKYNSLIEKFNL